MRKSRLYMACDTCGKEISGCAMFVVTYDNHNGEFCARCIAEFMSRMDEGDIVMVKLEIAPNACEVENA